MRWLWHWISEHAGLIGVLLGIFVLRPAYAAYQDRRIRKAIARRPGLAEILGLPLEGEPTRRAQAKLLTRVDQDDGTDHTLEPRQLKAKDTEPPLA